MGMVSTWVHSQLDEYTQVVPISYPTYTPCKRLGYTIGIPIDGYRLQSTQVLFIKEICDLPTGTYTSDLARDLPRKCHAPDAAFECNVSHWTYVYGSMLARWIIWRVYLDEISILIYNSQPTGVIALYSGTSFLKAREDTILDVQNTVCSAISDLQGTGKFWSDKPEFGLTGVWLIRTLGFFERKFG